MGWKGALRSFSAASNRSKRASEQAERSRDRAGARIDRIEGGIEAELARDRGKVEQFEAKLTARPITSGGLAFDAARSRWSFKALSDETGVMRWTLSVALDSDAATWSGPIAAGSLGLDPHAIAVSTYGVFVAFKRESTGTKKPPKLLYRSDPSRNQLYLTVEGVNYRAIEGTLDSPDIDGIGIVAFPLPDSDAPNGEIRLQTDAGTVSATVTMAQGGWRSLAAAESSLAKRFEEQADAVLAETRGQIEATRAKIAQKSSGCALVVAAFLLGSFAVATSTTLALLG
jgi:hypothetical protein